MKMERLDARCTRILNDAGWFEGRSADLARVDADLTREGLVLFPSAAAALANFLGLTVPNDRGGFFFDIAAPLKVVDGRAIASLAGIVGAELCPIACVPACGPTSVVLAASNGEFLLLENQWIGLEVFPSLEDFLLAIAAFPTGTSRAFVFTDEGRLEPA